MGSYFVDTNPVSCPNCPKQTFTPGLLVTQQHDLDLPRRLVDRSRGVGVGLVMGAWSRATAVMSWAAIGTQQATVAQHLH